MLQFLYSRVELPGHSTKQAGRHVRQPRLREHSWVHGQLQAVHLATACLHRASKNEPPSDEVRVPSASGRPFRQSHGDQKGTVWLLKGAFVARCTACLASCPIPCRDARHSASSACAGEDWKPSPAHRCTTLTFKYDQYGRFLFYSFTIILAVVQFFLPSGVEVRRRKAPASTWLA